MAALVTVEDLRGSLKLAPDTPASELGLCLRAAMEKAKIAGIPEFQNNALYDLFILQLAGFWFDNRNLAFIGSGNRGTANAEKNSRALINSFVLELRYAKDGPAPEEVSQ